MSEKSAGGRGAAVIGLFGTFTFGTFGTFSEPSAWLEVVAGSGFRDDDFSRTIAGANNRI